MVDEFKAQLTMMYTAAKVDFPTYANLVSDCCHELDSSLVVYQNQLGPTGNPEPLADAVAMNQECYNLLRRAVIFLDNGATAIKFAADEFAKTDEAAAQASADLQTLINKPLVNAPVPSTLPQGAS